MKNIYSFCMLALLALNSCLIKEPEPRQATVIVDKSTIGPPTMNYTSPTCNEKVNTIISDFSSLSSEFNQVSQSEVNDFTIVRAQDNQKNKIAITIKNFKPLSGDYIITGGAIFLDNYAAIDVIANSNDPNAKYNLTSKTGVLHILYDKANKTWTLDFCDAIFQFKSSSVTTKISGKIELK